MAIHCRVPNGRTDSTAFSLASRLLSDLGVWTPLSGSMTEGATEAGSCIELIVLKCDCKRGKMGGGEILKIGENGMEVESGLRVDEMR